MPKKPERRPTPLSYPQVGISMPLCIVIGFLAGRYLDTLFGTRPLLLVLLTLAGVVAGYVQLFRLNKKG